MSYCCTLCGWVEIRVPIQVCACFAGAITKILTLFRRKQINRRERQLYTCYYSPSVEPGSYPGGNTRLI